MTLSEFIAKKPPELRLGQWFVNSYCKPVEGRWEALADTLYELDRRDAMVAIKAVMIAWQWDELPPIAEGKQ